MQIENGEITILSTNDIVCDCLQIPIKVTKINLYLGNIGLQRIAFGKNVISVGEEVFIDNILREVVLNNKLKEIKAKAFYNNKLNTIKIPVSIEIIEKGAFCKNKIKEVKISKNTKVAEGAFDPEVIITRI